MNNDSNGVGQIQKVLDLFKIAYQTEQTFEQLSFGADDTQIPVDFTMTINNRQALIEFNNGNFSVEKLAAILAFSQIKKLPLLMFDQRDEEDIQPIVSKFIDDVRSQIKPQTQTYVQHTKGYFYDWNELSASKEISQPKNTGVEITKPELNQLIHENEDYQKEIAAYKEVLRQFTEQVNSLNDQVLKNNQKIMEMQSEQFSDIINDFEGDFRLHGSKNGHLAEPAKRLVYVVTKNLACNWVEIQRYFANNYNESVSISTIKRIYRRKSAGK